MFCNLAIEKALSCNEEIFGIYGGSHQLTGTPLRILWDGHQRGRHSTSELELFWAS
tara:strand:- start:446 stop:613 length:168 start_codon:yes stop_codon:yes gene_type:complete